MGTYLVTGIVQKIIVSKKDLTGKNIAIDDISNQLKEEINLDYYNLNENDDCYSWNIFSNVLAKNLDCFLEDQFNMYYENKEEWPIDILKAIKEASTGEEIILLASQKPSEHFKKVDNIVEIVYVSDPSGFKRKITIDYQLIAFFMDGKIIMETYTDILRYYSRNIRLQKEKHPIADCIKVCITA